MGTAMDTATALTGERLQWLQAQPPGQPVELDGEVVCLAVRADGAELSVCLIDNPSPAQLENAMRYGFRSATMFDAGLGLSADGKVLVLSRWLPKVSNWAQAAKPLQALLEQVGAWRADFAPQPVVADKMANRNEQRLRSLFKGARS